MKYIVYIQAERYYKAYGWKGCNRKTFKTKECADECEAFYKNLNDVYYTKIVEKESVKK